MIRSYFKTAIRRLSKQPFYTLLNLGALTLSMSVALLVIYIVYNQFNYDASNRKRDCIYRINTSIVTKDGDIEEYATSPFMLQHFLDSAAFDNWTNLTSIPLKTISYEDKQLMASGFFTSNSFFDIFSFPIIGGNSKSPLAGPESIVLSRETALKMFNSEACVGKTIRILNVGNFVVSAIFDQEKYKSHIKSDFLISRDIIPNLLKQRKIDSALTSMASYYGSHLYVNVPKKFSKEDFVKDLQSLSQQYNTKYELPYNLAKVEFKPQPLSKISPKRDVILDNSQAISISTIFVLSAIVVTLLLLACFNYASVTLALGLTRSKEIAVRKINGAGKREVFFQFIVESLIIVFFAFLASLLIYPLLARYGSFDSLLRNAEFEIGLLLVFLLFSTIVGFSAGFFPSLVLSKMKEINLMTNILNNRAIKGIQFRKIMIVIQFSVSSALILFVLAVYGQSKYMTEADYGFRYQNLINIQVNNERELNIIKSEVQRLSGVEEVSAISTTFGYMPSENYSAWRDQKSKKTDFSAYFIDENVVSNMKLSLISGTNFSSDSAYNANQVLINESGYKKLGYNSTEQALGQEFYLNDSTRCRILGIIKDFHFQNFKRAIGPMIFRYDPEKLSVINIRVHPSRISSVINRLNSVEYSSKLGRKLDPVIFEDEFKYRQAHEGDILMLSFTSVMFLSIASLGLVGVISFTTQQRFKEMTIRKILGANIFEVFKLLTKEFIILLFISVSVGLPVGYLMSEKFLSTFAYRIDISLTMFATGLFVVMLISSAILITMTVKTAFAKPIENLKEQ